MFNAVKKTTLEKTQTQEQQPGGLFAMRFGDVEVGKLVMITAQLALVLTVAHLFRIEENRGFLSLIPLLFGGFVIHALLPRRFRLPFFLVLSLAAFWAVLGVDALWLGGLGLALIGLCHLPVAYGLRVALVVLAGGGLVALRAEWVPTPSPSLATVVLPVLGAIFMFRLIVYLYDIRHERQPATIWERLSYFFLLPNVCFPLFPVVDYQTFRRTYYDRQDAHEIYQKGVFWVFRGVTHLILYRLVYYYLVPSPSEVTDLAGVVQYMLGTYLLYLRISGLFHMAIGLLCLFGFNLPETHHLYYLASSFNDYWRRINIYWKDFMMKLFYYPSFMQLRRFGMTTGMVLATVVVFAGTWLLHSIQWFWLRGTFPITAPDALFWGILGGLVALNAVREAKRGRKRSLGKEAWSLQASAVYAVQVVSMFVFIMVLWTLWSSATVGEFVALMGVATGGALMDYVWLILGLALVVGMGVLVQWLNSRGVELSVTGSHPSFRRSAIVTTVGAALLALMGVTRIQQAVFGSERAVVVASLQESHFNRRDEELRERGYYEGLLEAGKFTNQLWEVQQPKDWKVIGETNAARQTHDLLRYELVPSMQITFHRAPFSINRWGMRDKDYEQARPPDTYRVALLGKSYEMGGGSKNDETFEAVAEARLNAEYAPLTRQHYEILNFAVGGYTLLDLVVLTREKVFAFEPNAVFYTGHSVEQRILFNRLSQVVKRGVSLPPDLDALLQRAGVKPGMEQTETRRLLKPFADELIGWGYKAIVEACRAHGVLPVWVFVPRTDDGGEEYEATKAHLTTLAREAGFLTLSLDDAYGNIDRRLIQLVQWDTHANAAGLKMLGNRLFEVMVEHADELGLRTTVTDGTQKP